ncbi:uncharacterized protein G2W53_028996 [Senna tora]|uniref:Uncharacterized protein n=1 Tax=Senna tora TaxID=362788 RepID=A0A834T6W9_9FABA|nr:uncharacterized protein G2W53_028996 [Senna tora]
MPAADMAGVATLAVWVETWVTSSGRHPTFVDFHPS